MSVQTADGQYTFEGVEDVLTILLAADPLSGAKLHLYQASFAPTFASAYADFVAHEANFTGYSAATLTWSAIGVDGAGNPRVLSSRSFFQATDAVAPNVIGGAFMTHDVTGPPAVHTSIEFYPFQTPVNLTTAGAAIGVVIDCGMPASPGSATVDY